MTGASVEHGHHPGQAQPGRERLVLRPRRPEDLAPLVVLLQRTHEQSGYPVRAAAVSAPWLAAPEELHAAVVVAGDRVVGHVALHPAGDDDPAPDGPPDERLPDERHAEERPPDGEAAARRGWTQATGRSSDGLAVVSRLFTDGSVPGSGTLLLEHAVATAAALGRVAVLLVDPDSPARAFYRRRRWREVGTAVQQWGHRTVDAVLMVPGPPPRP